MQKSEAPENESPVTAFVTRWQRSAAAERANYQLFLTELCALLGVGTPEPATANAAHNAYVFERSVKFQNMDGTQSDGRIDLYKRGCFVLEAKQGSEPAKDDDPFRLSARPTRNRRGTAVRGTPSWDGAMERARGQAEQYARALPRDEGWPPFLIVVDVGHVIELFAEFTKSGRTYLPFPDPGSFRIRLEQLSDPEQREKLRLVWTDPLSLDPSRRSAKVTRELADRLAKLARSLEAAKYEPGRVSQFLMRCLFTMFAEDVDLIPRDSFKRLLESLQSNIQIFPDMVSGLWSAMNTGAFSQILQQKVRQFNGGLFEDCEALPLDANQLALLLDASKAQWRDVEPAIFGTLLERALDPVERHKLGAHYTPRAYVERLVMPTIIEPLREEWDAVRAAAMTLAQRSDTKAAIEIVRDFHHKLCETRVLDPACGTGNFLYVALEHMKRLEGEILNTLRDFGYNQTEIITVDPHQFLGIEVNPRAAAIADLVLWIGYLQWHLRTRDLSQLNEPIIRKFDNIECRDAVLAWDAIEPVFDADGRPVTRWDGRTTKRHPVTEEEVPDEASQVQELRYINPRKAEWPKADFIVGNPPFIGKLFQLTALGDGYIGALRHVFAGSVDGSADFVMYWWDRAAALVSSGQVKRFGLITTNSIKQSFNRRCVAMHIRAKTPVSLIFACPDHPWVDTSMCAAVRIAMTVGVQGRAAGTLVTASNEIPSEDGASMVTFVTRVGAISEMLRIGADLGSVKSLRSNEKLASMGPALGSRGFVIDAQTRDAFIRDDGVLLIGRIKPLRNGRDLLSDPRGVFAIDLHGENDEGSIRTKFARTYQHLYNTVRPERIHNRDARLQRLWWQFRRSNEAYRAMMKELATFIVTVETAKHRLFFMQSTDILAEHGTIAFGLADTFCFGVLSSRIHTVWALANGGTLEDRPRYNKSVCFDPFAFPDRNSIHATTIRRLSEQLEKHRTRQQELYQALTMTGMYNVLEKLRSGEELTAKEKQIHEKGLVSVLKQIHDELDAAVFDAYGWPHDLTDEEILERLVALNHERAEEEKRGLIRWLRPEFQNRSSQTQQTIEIDDTADEEVAPTKKPAKAKKLPLPKTLPEQVLAIRQQLAAASKPLTAADMAKLFNRAKADRILELLQSLVILGTARRVEGDKFVTA